MIEPIRTRKTIGLLALALAGTFSLTGIAAANESSDVAEGVLATPEIIIDEENGLVYIGLPVDGELPECGPEAEPAVEDGFEDDAYAPGDCIEVVVDHPSGKTHHGAVVSSVAKSLHPSMLDGVKKGEIMRWVAKSGKSDGPETTDKVTGQDKPKKDKPEKGARGRSGK